MSKTTWETTSVQNLLRNGASGRYYARWTFTVNGKSRQKWDNRDTDVFSVAKLRIMDEGGRVEALRQSRVAVASGKGTVGDLIAVYRENARARARCRCEPRRTNWSSCFGQRSPERSLRI